MMIDQDKIKDILSRAKTIAVVGASPNQARPSNIVSRYLIENGYTVIPVRPKVAEILGSPCFGRLEDIPEKIDIVDVFRQPDACPDIARSAAAIGARVLWLQEGVKSEDAYRIATDNGLEVVMDSCIKKIHKALLSGSDV